MKFNGKISQFVLGFTPADMSVLDVTPEDAFLNFQKKLFYVFFGTFTDKFYASVRQILHPADKIQIQRETLGCVAKTDSLYPPAVIHVRALNILVFGGLFLHGNTPSSLKSADFLAKPNA